MGEHRRRAQRMQQLEAAGEAAHLPTGEETMTTPELSALAESEASAPQEEQSAAPRRRRRAQPPQPITQRMRRISLPEDAQIPRLPEKKEEKAEKKRYKKEAKKQKPVRKKDTAAQKQHREKAQKAAATCAKAGSTAAKAAGSVLLTICVLLMEGLKRGSALAAKLAEKIRSLIAGWTQESGGAQPEHEEVVLEAIRPQDYHGRGVQHVQANTAAKKSGAVRRKGKVIDLSGDKAQRLISAALVLVAAFSLFQIGSILWRTIRTTRLNAQLSERYASLSGDMQTDVDEETAFTVYDGAASQIVPIEETPGPGQEDVTAHEEAHAELEEAQAAVEPAATRAPDVVKTTKYHHMGGDALPEMEALYNENRDLVAWINIPEVIDLPVVYKDNDYYLKRDFYKQKNTAGTIFLDVNHPFKEKTQNLLLHGHNMKDGTMFGRLTQYIYDRTYIKNHPFINLSTLWRKEQYVIFAVLDVSLDPKNEAFFNYFTHDTFTSDAEFTSYIRQLQLRSMFAIPIDVEPSDALLTLSTCLEENRLVIVARRVRPGETRAELRQRIHTLIRQ